MNAYSFVSFVIFLLFCCLNKSRIVFHYYIDEIIHVFFFIESTLRLWSFCFWTTSSLIKIMNYQTTYRGQFFQVEFEKFAIYFFDKLNSILWKQNSNRGICDTVNFNSHFVMIYRNQISKIFHRNSITLSLAFSWYYMWWSLGNIHHFTNILSFNASLFGL